MALKDQLESAGYDTSGLDESKILSQLDQAGYDTSALKGPQAPQESKGKMWAKRVANALPTIGAIGLPSAAALASTGLSLPASAGLAGLGGGAGVAAKQLILRSLGEPTPDTSLGAAKDIGLEGIKDAALTYAGGKALQYAPKLLSGAKALAFGPNSAEAGLAGKEAIADIAAKGGEKLAAARELASAAKQGLIGAEEKAGIHFTSTPEFEQMIKDPDEMTKFIENIYPKIKQGAQELSQTGDTQSLQTIRKIAQEGEKISGLSDIAKAHLREIKDATSQAVGINEPVVGEQLSRLREANQVASDIPSEIRAKIADQKLRNAADIVDARKLENTRKLVKAGLAAGAGYIGLKKIIH